MNIGHLVSVSRPYLIHCVLGVTNALRIAELRLYLLDIEYSILAFRHMAIVFDNSSLTTRFILVSL